MSSQANTFTLQTLVRSQARVQRDRPALVEDGRTITWSALEARTNRLARALAAQGIGRGDRIALLLPDGAQFIEMMIAAGKLGAIAMLLNWRLAPAELDWIIGNGAPRALYLAERFAALVPAGGGLDQHVIADEPAGLARYESWASEGLDTPMDTGISGDDPLFMMFTSGTTGRPKGCLHGHAATAIAALSFAARRGLVRTDVNLSTLPLFHVAGLGHVWATLAVGGASVFAPREAAGQALIEFAVRHRCSVATLGPGLITALRGCDESAATGLAFRTLTGAAGMADPSKMAFLVDRTNALLVGGWGQTETWSWGTQIDWPDMLEHPSAIGWPLPHAEMCVLGANGQPHPDPDAEGEMGFRGPTAMLGYWNNPDATEAAMGTGWLRTGDIAVQDRHGLFHMKGRAKELIKTGGENVYPVEVEEVIKTLPGVLDAAIAGVKDRRWGEAVKAFVVLRPGATLSAETIIAACRAAIAGYKRPRYLEFVDAIPRDHLGKIQRRDLAARGATAEQAVP